MTPPIDSTVTTDAALDIAGSVDVNEETNADTHPLDLHLPTGRLDRPTQEVALTPRWPFRLVRAFDQIGFVECAEE